MKTVFSALFLAAIVFCNGNAQEYTFDIPSADDEEEVLAWSGNFDAKYYIFQLKEDSPFYKLSYADKDSISAYLSQYRMELYLDGNYQTKHIGFHLKTHTNYYDDSKAADFAFFEAYGNVNLSINSFVQAGKQM